MATRAELATYRRTQSDVVTLARRDLVTWWAAVDTSDAMAARRALQAFLPELVAAYGDMSASVAADWYDELRSGAPVRGSYRATLVEPPPVEQVRATARWGVGPLFTVNPDPGRALSLLGGAVQRLVQQGGRSTLTNNALRDPSPPRWARVPTSLSPCAFCVMLAGRGFAYHSRQSAGEASAYHDECGCQPVPDWSPTPTLDGYDPDALRQQYLTARAQAGGNPRAILAQMRQDLGIN